MLRDEDIIKLQAYAVVRESLSQKHRHSRSNEKAYQAKLSQTATSLSVIVYGTMDIFEDVGDFLSQCSKYLQAPLYCDRDVPYRNPQSLAGRDENPPTTFHLQESFSVSKVETINKEGDPSAALETEDNLPETEAPPVVQTSLYR